MAVIDGVIMKGRCIVIPEVLQQQVLDQLHINHMGIEKTKLLACQSIYWAKINRNIDQYIENCTISTDAAQNIPKRPSAVLQPDFKSNQYQLPSLLSSSQPPECIPPILFEHSAACPKK